MAVRAYVLRRDIDTETDEIIAKWTEADWQDFLSRYMVAQFPSDHAGRRRPRASIPAQPDDDDLVLARVIHYARIGMVFSDLEHHLALKGN